MTHTSAVRESESDRKLRRRYAAVMGAIGHRLNDRKPWYRRCTFMGVITLTFLRAQLRSANLFGSKPSLARANHVGPAVWSVRSVTGVDNYGLNDQPARLMGSVGNSFGRNIAPRDLVFDDPTADPDPVRISSELLARREFRAADRLNLLAAGWIQLQVHDWFDHGVGEPTDPIELPWPGGPVNPMRIRRTPSNRTNRPPTFYSQDTHWWDASQIYGKTPDEWGALERSGWTFNVDRRHGLLPRPYWLRRTDDPGVNRNSWLGLELIRALFMMEHDSVMAALRENEKGLPDERRADIARMIVAALMAKIHTLEWTAAMLDEPATLFGTRQVWWGSLGRNGNRLLSWTRMAWLAGTPGSRRRLHGVDYSITEEFVSVYRLHSLLPDEVVIRQPFGRPGAFPVVVPLRDVVTPHTAAAMDIHLMSDLLYSFGRMPCGRLTLNNYPETLRSLRPRDYPTEPIDLAAVDIVRDRERGVPRYNEFRRQLHLTAIKRFQDLSADPNTVRTLARLYNGDIERVDLQVGLLTEQVPAGFAFSETAFRVFLLMAERRLEADRFYTTDFNKRTYTRTGFEWIRRETMSSVLRRHFPELEGALAGIENPFSPWNFVG